MTNLNNLPNLPKTQNIELDLTDLEGLDLDDDELEKDIFQNLNEENNTLDSLDSLLDSDFLNEENSDNNNEDDTDDYNFDDLDLGDLDDLIEDEDNKLNTENNPEDDFSDLDSLDFDDDILEDNNSQEKLIEQNDEAIEDILGLDDEEIVAEQKEDIDFELDNLFEDEIKETSPVINNSPQKQEKIVDNNEEIVQDNNPKEIFIPTKTPSWFEGLQNKYISSISHAFLLDFNTKDYIAGRENLESYITEYAEIGTFDIVIKYDLAAGLQFIGPTPELSKEYFLDATGLNEKKNSLQQDELYAALADDTINEDEEPAIPESPLDIFSLIAPLFKQEAEHGNNGKILLYLNAIDMLLPDAPIAQMQINDRKLLMLIENIASSPAADANNNLLIMVANNGQDVHGSLKRASTRIEKINLPLPSKEERLEFIEEELVKRQGLGTIFENTKLTPAGFSNLSAGLSKMQIEDIAFRAVSETETDGHITDNLVRERKTDIIKAEYEDVIEIIDSDITFDDIGGMEIIKEYFREEVINPIKSGSEELWMVPLGVMFLGPAGTGKTLLAQAVAKESQMNCVNLNIAKILNKYVGASEKNFEKALQCISSMEPTIVIVEEIDNVFNGRGNDSSGVGGRLFKRFLEFMSDTTRRGKVIVIATSNYPSRMDAALKRPGRFDKKIPFLVPETEGRLSIINVLSKRKGFEFEIKDLNGIKAINDKQEQQKMLKILKTTDGMTGAELETIVQKAITYAYKEKRNYVSIDDVYKATTVVIPSTSAIQEMTAEALTECNDLDFIPEKYRAYATQLKEKLVQKAPAMEPGSVSGNG